MTPTQKVLFGSFIRDVGIPPRFPVFSESHFDSFMEKCSGKHNLYCSISRYKHPSYYSDKIFYDFDADWDGLFDVKTNPPEKFEILRESPSLAREFLGEVVADSKRLVKRSLEEDIPVVGAFTGKGVHVYQLYQEEEYPREEMLSTANKYKEELGLETLDPKPIGDVMRIARIPGSQRIWNEVPCPLFAVPLTSAEMLEMDAEWLLSISESPRTLDTISVGERPKMTVYDDYLHSYGRNIPQQEFSPDEVGIGDDFLEWFIRRVVKMPCVSERALSRNPNHEVRLNLAIHLFNAGLSRKSVLDIISRLRWEDFSRETTKKQLNQIYRKGYTEFGCRRMQDEGLCVHHENPRECPSYGWRSGDECKWKI